MSMDVAILLANASSTLLLCGLIWTIQLVHYPSFHYVTPDRFTHFEAFHQRRIRLLVVPLMLVELISAVGLLWYRPEALPGLWAVFGVVLVGLIWGTTFTLQLPIHKRLAGGYDKQAVTALVTGNWFRTIAWTLRALLVIGGIGLLLMGEAPPT